MNKYYALLVGTVTPYNQLFEASSKESLERVIMRYVNDLDGEDKRYNLYVFYGQEYTFTTDDGAFKIQHVIDDIDHV